MGRRRSWVRTFWRQKAEGSGPNVAIWAGAALVVFVLLVMSIPYILLALR